MNNPLDSIDQFLDGPYSKYYLLLAVVFPILELMCVGSKKKRKTMSFEKKVGEMFTWKGHDLKVVESLGCKDCFFRDYENCYEMIFATGPCINRKDGKTVEFVELIKKEKDGKDND